MTLRLLTVAAALLAAPAHADYMTEKTAAVRAEAWDKASSLDALYAGDSIFDGINFGTICGARAQNAAVAGSQVATVRTLLASLVPMLRPEKIIISVGKNDRTLGAEAATVGTRIDALIADLISYGVTLDRIVLVGVPFDADTSQQIWFRSYLSGYALKYIAPADGSGETVDSIGHPSSAGQAVLRTRIGAACQ